MKKLRSAVWVLLEGGENDDNNEDEEVDTVVIELDNNANVVE